MKMHKVFGYSVAAAILLAVVTASTTTAFQSNELFDGEVSGQRSASPYTASQIETEVLQDNQIRLVQYTCDGNCGPNCGCNAPTARWPKISGGRSSSRPCPCESVRTRRPQLHRTNQPPSAQAPGAVKSVLGVNEYVCKNLCREANFGDSQLVPWEMFAYGEYIGPHRTPHVPEYRLRVNDQLEFVYYLNRRQSMRAYQIFVGDVIQISSATDESINQPLVNVLSDGMVSLPLIGQVRAASKTLSDLQDELNELYEQYIKDPSILVQIVEGDTPLRDIRDAVDARGGVGGQLRQATVSPDGTVQLPVIGSIPAVGLTLDEIRREVNARYDDRVKGLEVTPVLVERAPRFVYVLGQVTTPGRFELEGPTTVLQAIALAEGDLQGGNLRNVIVFRRDESWRLTATRLDLAGAIHGRKPVPSDEIFIRDSDIVLIPRKPIQRLSEAVDLYLTQTLYAAVPQEVLFQDTFQSVFAGSGGTVTP